MSRSDGFLDFVLDQLEWAGEVVSRRMFGGTGLYCNGTFFAIVDGGRLYFKVDDESRGQYEKYGMQAFAPNSDQTLKTYYEVPVDILEDDGLLVQWARRAVEAQERKRAGRGKHPKGTTRGRSR